jgi:hypothetical protein
VTRTGTKLQSKRAERCEQGHSKHSPGTDVAAVRPVAAQMCRRRGESRRRVRLQYRANTGVVVGRCVKRIANLRARPFASEHFFRQEPKEGSAEAHPLVHAIWRG